MAWNLPGDIFQAGRVTTAADLNLVLRDNLNTAFPLATGPDVWEPWTPILRGSVTNPTLGNSSLVGTLMLHGSVIHYRLRLTVGSTFNPGSGDYTVWMPYVPNQNQSIGDNAGYGQVNNTLRRPISATFTETANVGMISFSRSSTEALVGSAGVGAAWATGNTLSLMGSYERRSAPSP